MIPRPCTAAGTPGASPAFFWISRPPLALAASESFGTASAAGSTIPVGPLAHVLTGALDEAALLVVRDPQATEPVIETLERLLEGLRAAPAPPTSKRSART